MASRMDAILREIGLSTNRIYSLPVLVLMPHGGCNCRCSMCDIWKHNGEAELLSLEQVAGWTGAFRRLRVRQVVLSGGEPLLHPEFRDMCDLLRGLPARIVLLTNGLLLEREAENVARGCDEVVVSLDGPGPVHDEIRGVPGAFARLAAGVSAVKRIAPGRRVTARCTIQHRNFRQIAETVEAAWEMGLDQISFLAVDVSTSAFNRPEGWEPERVEESALSPTEAEEFSGLLDRFIATHEAEFAAGFVAENPAKLRRLVDYFAALCGDGPFPPVRCNAPWVSAVVEADGTVRPCFFQRPLGNVRDRPLDAILNSPEAIVFRTGLDVRRDPICRKCVCTLKLG